MNDTSNWVKLNVIYYTFIDLWTDVRLGWSLVLFIVLLILNKCVVIAFKADFSSSENGLCTKGVTVRYVYLKNFSKWKIKEVTAVSHAIFFICVIVLFYELFYQWICSHILIFTYHSGVSVPTSNPWQRLLCDQVDCICNHLICRLPQDMSCRYGNICVIPLKIYHRFFFSFVLSLLS